MPVTCSTSRLLIASGSLDRRRRDIGDERHGGRLDRRPCSSASRMASAAGCISAQWNGALTGSSTARRAPNFGASSTARSIAVLAPQITTWPGALSLAASQTSPSAAALASSWLGEIGAEQRRHRPFADRHRLLHGAARVLSSRAVSARLRAPAAASAEYSPSEWPATKVTLSMKLEALLGEHAHRRERHRHQRRLRILGERQLSLGPLPHQLGQILAERLVDFGKHRARGRIGLGELGAHADGLASLTGKNESNAHRRE